MDEQEDVFIDFLKSLNMDLPEKGLKPSSIEIIEDDVEELDGNVLKITFELNLFMNHRKDRYFMLTTNQKMQNMGNMSLKDALVKFNTKPPKRRR